MKNLILSILVVVLSACSGGGGGGTSTPSGSTNTPWPSYSVVNQASLPTCAGEIVGRLYYVEASNNFQVCKNTGWSVINIGGGLSISSIKNISESNTDYCTFYTGELCQFQAGQILEFSDGSTLLTYRWGFSFNVSGDTDLDVVTDSVFIPASYTTSNKLIFNYVARSAAGYRAAYIRFQRSPLTIQIWHDTNNDFILNPAQDELLFTPSLSTIQ